MDVHACVLTRPSAGRGARVMIYVLAVIVVITARPSGYSLVDAAVVAIGTAYATAGALRWLVVGVPRVLW